jgi:hypothetical protein
MLNSISIITLRYKESLWCTEKTQYRKFETNIPRKGTAGPQSQCPHSSVCERFIFSHDWSACSAAGKYVDQSWEYINRSQTRECGDFLSGNTSMGFLLQCAAFFVFPRWHPLRPLPMIAEKRNQAERKTIQLRPRRQARHNSPRLMRIFYWTKTRSKIIFYFYFLLFVWQLTLCELYFIGDLSVITISGALPRLLHGCRAKNRTPDLPPCPTSPTDILLCPQVCYL